MSATAASAKGARQPTDHGILTLPNLISIGRLASVPLFLWLLLAREDQIAAAVLLAVLGATDWVDGWIARHFDQASDIGKVLDPTADR
ncbi:MAG: CDP-alcohol phosphatidyltransferase family protein, partial [Acidimicrobiia bacterium]